jgi:hypothetical protein
MGICGKGMGKGKMTEEEIKNAVEITYAGFVEWMKKVEGYMSVPSVNDLIQWEIYKDIKHKDDIKSETHANYDLIIKQEDCQPDD